MENQYEISAKIIRDYLDENNLGNYEQEIFEDSHVKFINQFGPEILESLEGIDLLHKMFLHDGEHDNLCYNLEFSKEFIYYGGIGGGSSFKYNLFKNKQSNEWIYGISKKNSSILNEEKAIEKATIIRDALVKGAHYIQNTTLETLEDYNSLEEELNKIFENCYTKPTHSWVHKYYAILFYDKFPTMHSGSMKKDFLRKFNIKPLDGFYANDWQFYQLSTKSNIKIYSLFYEDIIRLFYKGGETIWEPLDNESEEGLGDSNVDRTRYWLIAPGSNAYWWEDFYNKGLIAIGWNGTGNLKDFKNKNEINLKLQKIYKDKKSHRNDVHALWQFSNEIQKNDIVFAKKGMSEILGVGIVESDYEYDTNNEYHHIRRVNWIKKGYWKNKNKFPYKTLTDITYYEDFLNGIIKLVGGITPPHKLYTAEDFLNEVYINDDDYYILVDLLKNKKNLIVEGAPGVGKTFMAKRLAYSIIGEKNRERVMMVQFHQSYSYEDFVMGYRPYENGFKLKNGSFYEFCKMAENDPKNEYFFIIDEINRGNLSKIFGELFMLIEADKRGEKNRIQLLYSDELFFIPKNVYIIGLMNTADRSLAMIDYALRRRFAFFDLKPGFDSYGFKKYQEELDNKNFNDLIEVMNELNQEIFNDESLGEGFRIGHSYLCNIQIDEVEDKLNYIVEYELIPLLKEYWFDEPDKVDEWATKLRSVL